MRSKEDFSKTIEQISLLYELSLAVGSSLDLKINCDRFLKTLLARKNLGAASVWLKNSCLPGKGNDNGAALVYALPGFRTKEKSLPLNHPIFASLRNKDYFSIASSSKRFLKFVTEKRITKGSFALFSLGEIGILKLYSMTRKTPFPRAELGRLMKVIDQFAVSIEGCLSHRKVLHEIRERHRVEKQLRLLARAVEQSSEGVAITDLEWNLFFVNDAFAKMHGYAPSALLGRNLKIFHSPDQLLGVRKAVREVKDKGNFIGEIWHTRRDGSVFPTIMHSTLLRDEAGVPVGMVGTVRDITARKQVEEALRESEKRYRAVVEDQNELICRFRPDGKITFVNDAYCRYFDKRPEELLGKKFTPLIVKEDRDRIRREISSLSPEKPIGTVEERVKTPAGEVRWQQWTNRAVFDERGKVIEYQSVGRDFTERKQVEEALRESEDRFQQVAEHAREWIWEVDARGLYTYSSPVASQILGYQPEEIVGKKHFYDFFHPDEREKLEVKALAFFTEKRAFHEFVNRNIHRNGHSVWLSTSGVPLLDQNGNLTGYRGLDVDITDRKTAEEALRESEEKYRSIVERANDGIVIIQDGVIKYANPRLAEMAGCPPEELLGHPFTEYVHPEEVSKVVEHYRRRMAGEDVESVYETFLRREDDREVSAELNAGIVTYEGRPADLVIIRDITERKRLEEELLKASKLESLGIMAGGIAHDFNNILTGILGNIFLARILGKPGSEALARLGDAEKASLQAKNLTQQLLTFSKGGAPIKKTIAASQIMKDAVEFALSGSEVTCKMSIPDNLWPINADAGQISQVINNLIINAEQAMPERGTITVKAKNVRIDNKDGLPLKPGKYVKLSIADQGIGIKKSMIPKVFDPYFTTKQKGSGLGLTVAYSVIKNHGGLITVKSTPGKGSIFCVYLPASSRPVEFPQKEKARRWGGTGNILVVDDEEIVRDVATRTLQLMGYKVESTNAGEKALNLYRKALKSGRPYDAVIVDLVMPGRISGKMTARKLRAVDRGATIIALSGYSSDPIISSFKKHGFDGALAKPFKFNELGEVLQQAIGGREAADKSKGGESGK